MGDQPTQHESPEQHAAWIASQIGYPPGGTAQQCSRATAAEHITYAAAGSPKPRCPAQQSLRAHVRTTWLLLTIGRVAG
ncbi:hypothetical protein GCM10023205_27630 [Yinghuangia aomiensis]|uniref:Uncharacterized protein n=1 Tax=Yinghuangia aomiensis TaxID=676205 RepID=A0ABP9H6P9_9ACTN